MSTVKATMIQSRDVTAWLSVVVRREAPRWRRPRALPSPGPRRERHAHRAPQAPHPSRATRPGRAGRCGAGGGRAGRIDREQRVRAHGRRLRSGLGAGRPARHVRPAQRLRTGGSGLSGASGPPTAGRRTPPRRPGWTPTAARGSATDRWWFQWWSIRASSVHCAGSCWSRSPRSAWSGSRAWCSPSCAQTSGWRARACRPSGRRCCRATAGCWPAGRRTSALPRSPGSPIRSPAAWSPRKPPGSAKGSTREASRATGRWARAGSRRPSRSVCGVVRGASCAPGGVRWPVPSRAPPRPFAPRSTPASRKPRSWGWAGALAG